MGDKEEAIKYLKRQLNEIIQAQHEFANKALAAIEAQKRALVKDLARNTLSEVEETEYLLRGWVICCNENITRRYNGMCWPCMLAEAHVGSL